MTNEELMDYVRERFDKVDAQQTSMVNEIKSHREEYIKEITTIKVRWGAVAVIISLTASGIFNFLIGLFRYE